MSPTPSVLKGQKIRDRSAQVLATAPTRRSWADAPASSWPVRFSSGNSSFSHRGSRRRVIPAGVPPPTGRRQPWAENPPTARPRRRAPLHRLARYTHRFRVSRAPRRLSRHLGAWTSRRRRRGGGDDGEETVELAVLFPVALVMLLAIVQAGLWWHAHTICRYAAIQAVQTVRTTTGTPGDAQAAAWDVLGRTGNATSTPTVSVAGGPVQVSVTVSATPLRLIPLPGTVFRASYTAAAQRERFVPEAREFANSEGDTGGNPSGGGGS